MRRLAQSFYRLIGISFGLLGAWILYINLVEISYSDWILVWILSAGFLGLLGSVLFLLSFDGPAKLRTGRVRLLGWLGILFLALLPWSFQFVMLLLALLLIPTLNQRPSTSDPTSLQGEG